MRPFTPSGFQSAGNPGVTFVVPSTWCSNTGISQMFTVGPSIPGAFTCSSLLAKHTTKKENAKCTKCTKCFKHPSTQLKQSTLFIITGLLEGQTSGLLQIIGNTACLNTQQQSEPSSPSAVWGGSVDNGNFLCSNTDNPLGQSGNTFSTYFAGKAYLMPRKGDIYLGINVPLNLYSIAH